MLELEDVAAISIGVEYKNRKQANDTFLALYAFLIAQAVECGNEQLKNLVVI